MNESERKIIQELKETNFELNKLYNEHIKLEQKLEPFSNKTYLTTEDEIEVKRLKVKKHHGVNRMMQIVNQKVLKKAA